MRGINTWHIKRGEVVGEEILRRYRWIGTLEHQKLGKKQKY